MRPPYDSKLEIESVRHALRSQGPARSLIPGLRPAAVLIALFETENGLYLWLIRRTEDGTAHSGQVALPGGKPNASDADLAQTALREAHEEMGVALDQVEVFGQLDDYVTITGFCISPFVGWITGAFEPRADPREVARVFCAPLSLFLGPGSRHEVSWGNCRRVVKAYQVQGETVWGATAAILQKFGERLKRLNDKDQ
jgi:8-oxo-dGTP pyrophosphatase MutT (NUDIX family)